MTVTVVRVLVAGALLTGAGVGAAPAPATTPPAPASFAAVPSGGSPVPAQAAAQCDPETARWIPDPPPAHARLGATRAWERATGAGVVVAVVDSGVDVRNDHLTDAVLPGTDVVGVDPDPSGRTDTDGHGTAIAGQIAARPVEGSGVVGLAPAASILPVRVYYATGERAEEEDVAVRTDRIAEGIRYAVEHGARVVNVSLSSTHDDPRLRAAVELATARGALVVASAGNRATTDDTTDSPRYPAAYDGVLGVAAVDGTGSPVAESIRGPHVDLAAPGTEVLTAFHDAGDCLLGAQASTSFATAYVSAAAALVAEAHPAETPAQWAHRLTATAARARVDARDDAVGWGVVRPAEALAFVDDGSVPGPPSPVHERPAPADARPAVLDLADRPDRGAYVREAAGWWFLAGLATVLTGALVGTLATRRSRGRRP